MLFAVLAIVHSASHHLTNFLDTTTDTVVMWVGGSGLAIGLIPLGSVLPESD